MLVGAALWGFGRVLINEMPRLSLRLVDLPPAMDAAERGASARRRAGGRDAGNRDRLDPTGRHVLRLRRGLPPRWASAG